MTVPIVWFERSRAIACRVCLTEGEGLQLAEINALGQVGLEAVRCPRCGSVQLAHTAQDSSPDDASIDAYIESGAGIGTIAACLAQVDPHAVSRFLDVGCNYGFALDLGRFAHGWHVTGVEPSLAGRRGAAELDLDIHADYLSDHSDVGDSFDLILASEVLEHVTEPLEFLQLLRRRLTPSGILILTTPAAEIVTPNAPAGEALAAISSGFHVFLASQDGLERLLRRAGFQAVHVVRERGTLRAAVSRDPDAARHFRFEAAASPNLLEAYYDFRADRALAGSALAVGMAVRHFRSLVSRGHWELTEPSSSRMISAMRQRHGLDLLSPRQIINGLASGVPAPWSLAGAAFSLGMHALLVGTGAEAAADYFQLTADAVDGWERVVGVLDLDSMDLRSQAVIHRAMALARFDPHGAVAAALELPPFREAGTGDVDRVTWRQCRIYVDLVARGWYAEVVDLAPLVSDAATGLACSRDDQERMAGLDALFSLGIAALNTGDPGTAHKWFELCELRCASGTKDNSHALELGELARRHGRLAASQSGSAP